MSISPAKHILQGRRAQQGCQQSHVDESDPEGNELYTQHIKLLKRNARCAVTLFHQASRIYTVAEQADIGSSVHVCIAHTIILRW